MGKHVAPRRRWRLSKAALAAGLLVVVGLTALLYPSAASWVSQYNQSQVIAGYESEVENASPSALNQLDLAHRYNQALQFGAEVEAHHRLPTGFGVNSDSELEYGKILLATPSGMMARLMIPSIDLDLPIYHGTSDETLLAGLGHLEGTSLPVGGKGTHSVITGHRGLAGATMFTNLDRVQVGDTLIIEVFGEVLTYQVESTIVVEPEDTESLRAKPDQDLVTLITCTPLGINSHRILVTGHRIPTLTDPPVRPGVTPQVPRFPWWVVYYLSGIVLTGVFVWRAGYPPRARGKKGRKKHKRGQMA